MEVRIYYEDTDAAGVVYHANYLKYFERARTEYFRERGLLVSELAAAGHVFPVVRMEVDFRSPARLDDLLSIETSTTQCSGSSFSLRQQIFRTCDNRLLVKALVKLACVGPDLKARRIPTEVRQIVESEAPMAVVGRQPDRFATQSLSALQGANRSTDRETKPE